MKGVLNHALKMPSVQKIIYSTFSTNRNENEVVVEKALKKEGSCSFELHAVPNEVMENVGDRMGK